MKILYHHRIASKDGQYVHVEELTKALRNRGHELIIVAPSVMEKDNFGSEGGMVAHLKKYLPKFLYELLEFAYAFHVYFKLARAVKQHRPDCLYERYNLFMPSGVWLKKRFKLPMLSEVNAPIFSERDKYNGVSLKALAKWSENYVWKNADGVLPVTDVLAGYIKDVGVPAQRIQVIANGIDLEKFNEIPDTAEAKAKLNLADKFVLGFTGFVREWHGLENVLDYIAAHRNKNMHLLLVGDGPAKLSLQQRAKALGIDNQLTITGIVARERILDYVAAFDVALQPDVVAYASPLKLFEYMILARVIVAPNSANIREVLSDGENALLFDNTKKNGLIEAIDTVCQDQALRKKISHNARQTIFDRNFTWDSNAEKVERLFTGLLSTEEALMNS